MQLQLLSTEILTVSLAIGLLILGLITPSQEGRKGTGPLAIVGLLGILIWTFTQYGINSSLLNGMFVVDDYSVFLKQIFLATAIMVCFSSLEYVAKLPGYRSEFYALVVFATLGMMIMASAGDLITLYVGMETMTVSFYILTAYELGEARSSEAGMKYLILGAMSSAVLLYGLSLIYGATGSVMIAEIAARVTAEPVFILGVVFLIAGFGFKVAAVPFHMWSPDIYEGAPTPVTAFLAVASKAAAFAVLLRVFLVGLLQVPVNWVMLIAVLAAITMVIGNLVAIPQTNIKRMLAYSSVAQAGYLLVGLVAASTDGVKGVLFYSMIYVFANVGAFAVAIAVENRTGSSLIQDFAGLSRRAPLLAAVMVICLLSLAGIPPLAGFVGKLYLFAAVMEQGYIWLALIGLVMSMISVYYYLMVAKAMYIDEGPDVSPITVGGGLKLTVLAAMILTVFFGVYPGPLAELANVAAESLKLF